MSYIRKIVNHQEKLLFIARPHWIYLVEASFWLIGLPSFGLLLDSVIPGSANSTYNLVAKMLYINLSPFLLFFSMIGLGIFLSLVLEFLSVEIGVTNHRVISKKGLFLIEVEEVELIDIRGEHVNHGLLGWLLGYGRVHIDCHYVGDVELPAVRDPYRLLRAMHKAKVKGGISTNDDLPTKGSKKTVLNGDIKEFPDQRCQGQCQRCIEQT